MKPIRFTRHARNRMRWHRIEEALVEETLRAADWEEASAAGRVNRWKRVAEQKRTVVISAVFKRRPPWGSAEP